MVRKISLWALAAALTALPLLGQGYFSVSQGAVQAVVQPLAGTVSVEEFYGYDNTQFLSTCPLVEPDATVMFLYLDPNQQLYLFIIHGQATQAPAGVNSSAQFVIQGVPAGADFVVTDDPSNMDPNDVYDIVAGRLAWVWAPFRTDGGVLGPLGQEFRLTLSPGIMIGVQRIVFKYGDIDAPQSLELNLTDPIEIIGMRGQPPVASLAVTPAEPRARQEITLDASASYDPDGRIVEYRWDFDGDGVVDLSSTDPTVRYTYPSGGSYNLELTLVDDMGLTTDYSLPLYISPVTVVVTRSISTTTAMPGYTFRVTVRIHTDQDLVGAGLEEQIPAGWEITPVESAGAVFKRPTIQWVFVEAIRAGTDRVITYDLTVPRSELLSTIRLPQQFCISGVFQAKVPDIVVEVGGESCVVVDDCLSVLEAITHMVVADPKTPGSQDKIDLRLSEVISAAQLARAGELWRTDRPVVGTCGERIDLETLKLAAAYAKACVPIDRPLPDMPEANVSAHRTIRSPIPCEGVVIGFYDPQGQPLGNKFTVKVEISTDQDVFGVGLDEDLPTGWRVNPIESDGFIYKAGVNQWALLDVLPAGETRQIIYEVEVPPTVTIEAPPADGCLVLASETIAGRVDTGQPCVEAEVAGQSRVDLTDCLSVIAAISRWDVNREAINLALSDKITFQQVQRAIAFWLEDEVVPRTCGDGKVTFELMKEIVARWLTDTPICEPLPGVVPDVCVGR
ncbi:TPA: hypothetical protein DCL37_05870 [Candidatus Acetothermia bacterium]|nr:hypothetical protein [Candidatus Acetothermia bacterium]